MRGFPKPPAACCRNLFPLYFAARTSAPLGRKLVCFSAFVLRTEKPVRLCDAVVTVGSLSVRPSFFLTSTKRLSSVHRGWYRFEIVLADTTVLEASTPVQMAFPTEGGVLSVPVTYTNFLVGFFLGHISAYAKDSKTGAVAVFRQTRENRLTVYARLWNVSDSLSCRLKLWMAFIVSLLWRTRRSRGLILLYEKFAARYEESASVLFEHLVESGRDGVYFILDKSEWQRVPERFRARLLAKHSFRHYLYFFRARTFIGTESMYSAYEPRTFNRLALAKISAKANSFVFLQHGVMYMVSLNAETRTMFKRRELRGKYRVVVSSQAEADHFIRLGGHRPEDLYVTGLPKFDRATRFANANRIVIMPTWRPWEVNIVRTAPEKTGYLRLIRRLCAAVPPELKDRITILPHPAFARELRGAAPELVALLRVPESYDEILRETCLLVTDYSSIAYDAFYRGARVLFFWEEKDACVAQYGASARLMLDESNVFGPVCHSLSEFVSRVTDAYENPQTEDEKSRFAKLVEFHDGHNTDRLVDCLKQDGLV